MFQLSRVLFVLQLLHGGFEQSPSLILICLDCLFPLLSVFVSLSPLRAESSQGCKVLLFPQLLSITPVTTRLSITSTSDPHSADRACWHTNTRIKKKKGGGDWKDEEKGGVLVSTCWVSLENLRRHRRIHTAGHQLCRYHFNFGHIYSASLHVASNHALLPCQHELLFLPNWRSHLAAAENHGARHTCKNRHGGTNGQSWRSRGKSEVKQFAALICQRTPKVRYFL